MDATAYWLIETGIPGPKKPAMQNGPQKQATYINYENEPKNNGKVPKTENEGGVLSFCKP